VDGKEETLKELMRSDPVKIVLFDGCRPGVNNAVWACPDTSYVVWFHFASNRLVVPQGWLLESHALKHNELGGVTNGGFRCRIARRITASPLEWPSDPLAVSSYLHQVIDPTLGGVLSEQEPEHEERALNTASGLLDWKDRFEKVLVPTVYSKHKWA
jgi:hypothetical protein